MIPDNGIRKQRYLEMPQKARCFTIVDKRFDGYCDTKGFIIG